MGCLVQVFAAAILAHGSAAFTTVGIESAGQECILAGFRLAGDAFSRKERSAWGEVGASSSVRAEPRVFATSKGLRRPGCSAAAALWAVATAGCFRSCLCSMQR